MLNENSRVIRKSFEKERPSEIIRISNNFVDEFLFEDSQIIDIPISALRIIANVLSIVRDNQFRPEDRPRQLSLFEDEFETENNVFAQFKIKNSAVSPSRSQKQIIDAYEFLAKYKMGWYKSVNSQGKTIKTFGALISTPSYDHRGYTSFLISSYWLKKLIVIPEYNRILFDLVYRIKNNKHVIFAIWLKRIPKEGSTLNLDTFNKRFGLNYGSAEDFCSKFLRPLRKILDEINDISFSYSYEKEKIFIKPYEKEVNSEIASKTVKIQSKLNYRLSYIKTRYLLSNEEFKKFKSCYLTSHVIIEKSYKDFVSEKKKAKITSTMFIGKKFLQELQFFIIKNYRETTIGKMLPDGFPQLL